MNFQATLTELTEIYKVTEFSVMPKAYHQKFRACIAAGEQIKQGDERAIKAWLKEAKGFLPAPE